MERSPLALSVGDLVGQVGQELAKANAARETALAACRAVIRACGSAIRAVHRLDSQSYATKLAEAEAALRQAQLTTREFPSIAHAGFLHDAEKEYAEAVLTRALVDSTTLPGPSDMHVGIPAWLNGLAEAASELRRHLLDRLRSDQSDVAETLFVAMQDVYEALLGVDYPDALTAGLRRSTDALRAVLERTRSDLTTTVIQLRLQRALEKGQGEVLPHGGDSR